MELHGDQSDHEAGGHSREENIRSLHILDYFQYPYNHNMIMTQK